MPKNYYIILGIPVNSSQEDIKAAYRRLAKEYHPDHYGKNQSPFQMIQEAYAVLSNPSQRSSYDKHLQEKVPADPSSKAHSQRRNFSQTIEPLIPEQEPLFTGTASLDRSIHNYLNTFDGMFDRMLSGFVGRSQPQRPQNQTIEVRLTPEQAQRGGNIHLRIPLYLNCPSCNFTGWKEFTGCWRCNGTGFLIGDKQVLLSSPPGVHDNHTIQLPTARLGQQDINLTTIFRIVKER